ncbi:MAG: ATP-binding protein [Deltaproteobacteria bacterium]|nr:ATP-binding protein [Deltaproteobacteria bacterium]
MKLAFLDRGAELARLRRLFARRAPSFAVLYGRRRLGKSRLLREALPSRRAVYAVGDEREAATQRASLAREIGRLLPGFERVTYPEWDALLERWWAEAPDGAVLALDEFPALVAAAHELPSLLQKRIDRAARPLHLVLAGSSQQMMQGLVLDRTAPLYGRADEILRLGPLPAGHIRRALRTDDPVRAVEDYAVWGGVPRYWELAADWRSRLAAVRELVLSPLGALHEEPARLLRDDLRDTAQAATLLGLLGQGCHRPSELAGRLGKPATSLSRPLQRLLELELARREVPCGASPRDSKRSSYCVADPFLRFWFRFVEPHLSLLGGGGMDAVVQAVERDFPAHAGGIWEELARGSVPGLRPGGLAWGAAARWWGPGLDRTPLEVDVVAESADGKTLLVGEARWTRAADVERLTAELRRKAGRLALAAGRRVVLGLWLRQPQRADADVTVYGPDDVLRALS